jgi:plasmid stability protein
MVDILVRNVDNATAAKLKKKAKAERRPVSDLARDARRAFVKTSEEEIWAEIDRVRERIGPVSRNSAADIRADRDNDEPYR